MIEFVDFFWVIKGTQELMQEEGLKLGAGESYKHIFSDCLAEFLKRDLLKK